jgi:hypothetical protein
VFIPIGDGWWGEWSRYDTFTASKLQDGTVERPDLLLVGNGESYPWPPATYAELLNPSPK